MPGKHKVLNKWGLNSLKAVSLLFFVLLQGNTVLAQQASPEKKLPGDGISAMEVLLMIAGIVLIALIAWFLGSSQSKNETPSVHHHPHKHYDHPNDPHFRKLKRKTS
ncbi:MAG: hypothetical protein ABUL44_02510 [Flavobacterium sp.]